MRRLAGLVALLLLWCAPCATRADMYPDASNAKLPEAMTNLYAQPVAIPDSKYMYFSVPGWGPCCYQAGAVFTGTGTAHPGYLRATVNISRNADGSTAFGPPHADVGLLLSAGKNNYLTSNIEGEIDALYVVAQQGRKGDVGAVVASAAKVRSNTAEDNGGLTGMELAGIWTNAAGNITWEVHTLSSFGVGFGADVSGGGGYGYLAGNSGPSAAGAADMIMPYSGVMVQNHDYSNQCPTHCSLWQNLLTGATLGSADPLSIYFQVKAGPTSSGDIMMGSGWPTIFGTPAQSGGTRLTLQNVSGNFRVLANNGTTPSFTLGQGASPVLAIQSTTLGPAAGGLWRQVLNSADGTMLWQKNTAVAGDFSTAETMFALDYNRARIIGAAAGLELRDNSTAITGGGLWRVGSTAGYFSIIKNTAAAGDFSTATAYLSVPPTGIQLPSLPTSAGGGGLAVCVDTDGTLYKKAACP